MALTSSMSTELGMYENHEHLMALAPFRHWYRLEPLSSVVSSEGR